MKRVFDLSLYLVTDCELSRGRDLCGIVSDAVAGGVTMVQIRDKKSSTKDFIELARSVKEAAKMANPEVAIVANDRVDVALAAELDGVHIGQSDMGYEDARRLLGEDKIIGLSVENMSQVEAANNIEGLDYIGISPIFATPTKEDTAKPFGIDGCRDAVEMSRHRAVAIGGMNRDTITDVIKQGVEGVAVVSAIIAAEEPRVAAAELKKVVDNEEL